MGSCIIKGGADIPVLHSAASNGQLNVLGKLLKKNKTDINSKDHTGLTPIMIASDKGHHKVVNFLLERGAAVEEKTKDGQNALMLAAHRGHTEIVHLLYQHGANIDERSTNGETALILAARKGHVDIVSLLIRVGTDVHLESNDGLTALTESSKYGHTDIERMLLDQGDKHAKISNRANSPLLFAREKVLKDLKDLALEFILKYVPTSDLRIQNTSEHKQKKFNFTLHGLNVSNLVIKKENVNVTVGDPTMLSGKEYISITANDISADLTHIKWCYQQKAFPFCKDSGFAKATVRNASIALGFKLKKITDAEAKQRPVILLASKKLTAENFNLKIDGSQLIISRFYNVLISHFKASIHGYVWAALEKFILKKSQNFIEKVNCISSGSWPVILKIAEVDMSELEEATEEDLATLTRVLSAKGSPLQNQLSSSADSGTLKSRKMLLEENKSQGAQNKIALNNSPLFHLLDLSVLYPGESLARYNIFFTRGVGSDLQLKAHETIKGCTEICNASTEIKKIGRIRLGDILISANNQALLGFETKEVLTALQRLGETLELQFCRNPDFYVEFVALPNSLKLEAKNNCVYVSDASQTCSLENACQEGLAQTKGPVTSASDVDQNVLTRTIQGTQLIEIGSQNVKVSSVKKCQHVFATSKFPLRLCFRNPVMYSELMDIDKTRLLKSLQERAL